MTSFVSTRGAGPVTFVEALVQGLAPDGGLYVPETFGILGAPDEGDAEFGTIARWTARALLGAEIDGDALDEVVDGALTFPVPLVEIEDDVWLLELFHGPSLAFKDIGARFMAHALERFAPPGPERTVLVATSGDTGGAVASAFRGLDGCRVCILFPHGGISDRQRRQMTTLGASVQAVAVTGTFDDCQALTKAALADGELRREIGLTSANSINVGRLVPQCFYYVYAAASFGWGQARPTFFVPSGNLGNLCAGLLALRWGMPTEGFVACSNPNDVFPEYVRSGHYSPRPSIPSISTAMDVGDPSNLERIQWLYQNDTGALAKDVSVTSASDGQTRDVIRRVFDRTGYALDPHSAVAFAAIEEHGTREGPAVVLATAHPAKFPEVVEEATGEAVALPATLAASRAATERYETIPPDYASLNALLRAGPRL